MGGGQATDSARRSHDPSVLLSTHTLSEAQTSIDKIIAQGRKIKVDQVESREGKARESMSVSPQIAPDSSKVVLGSQNTAPAQQGWRFLFEMARIRSYGDDIL